MFKIAALYKFVNIEDPESLKVELLAVCKELNIIGTLIIATEGINGTVAGPVEGIDKLMARFESDQSFKGMELKFSYADEQPFYRTRISVKNEIVTMGCPNIDPTGEYNALLAH